MTECEKFSRAGETTDNNMSLASLTPGKVNEV